MKRFIYLKPCKYIRLAHLYEHMVAIEFNKIMREHKLYQHVDYTFIPKTYHGGMIYVEFLQYSEIKLDINNLFINLKLRVSDDDIDLCLKQISAEDGVAVTGDFKKIRNKINWLHNQRWQSIDDFSAIDAASVRRMVNWPLTKKNKVDIRKLQIKITIGSGLLESNPLLQPLFRQLSYVIATNLADFLCDKFGLFCSDVYYEKQQLVCTVVGDKNSINIVKGADIKSFINQMIKDGATDRMTNDLANMSYIENLDQAVSFENNFEDTLVFIGSYGWRKISTIKNMNLILKNLIIEIKTGNSTTHINVK